MARRCGNDAADGALSALCVLNSSRNRYGDGWCFVQDSWSAERARARWALCGGLKDESRMNRVLGDGGLLADALMERTTRNVDWDEWKDLRAVSSCGTMARIVLLELFTDAIFVYILGVADGEKETNGALGGLLREDGHGICRVVQQYYVHYLHSIVDVL